MSEHFTWNRQEERNGLNKGRTTLKIQVVTIKKLTVGELFPQTVNEYFIFFKENITNSLYEEILEDYLPEFKRICKGDVKILMDNHPVYKSMNSLLFYKEHKIKVIDFPPYSPDLNPIENIWEKIKKEITKKEYQTLSVMTKDIWKEWDSITESQLRYYSASMNDRMKSWLQLKGSITKY